MTSIWKWESGNLQIKKSLLDGLQITETAKEVISVVGAGGKTTTIRRLTDEMEKRQKNNKNGDFTNSQFVLSLKWLIVESHRRRPHDETEERYTACCHAGAYFYE